MEWRQELLLDLLKSRVQCFKPDLPYFSIGPLEVACQIKFSLQILSLYDRNLVYISIALTIDTVN